MIDEELYYMDEGSFLLELEAVIINYAQWANSLAIYPNLLFIKWKMDDLIIIVKLYGYADFKLIISKLNLLISPLNS